MTWIRTTTGACNSRHVVKIERGADGTLLHLVDGSTVMTSILFDIINGELVEIEPIEDDSDVPF